MMCLLSYDSKIFVSTIWPLNKSNDTIQKVRLREAVLFAWRHSSYKTHEPKSFASQKLDNIDIRRVISISEAYRKQDIPPSGHNDVEATADNDAMCEPLLPDAEKILQESAPNSSACQRTKHARQMLYRCRYVEFNGQVCELYFSSLRCLQRHQLARKQRKDLTCKHDGCWKVFRKPSTLREHLLKEHHTELTTDGPS